jgi:hypothetical protein
MRIVVHLIKIHRMPAAAAHRLHQATGALKIWNAVSPPRSVAQGILKPPFLILRLPHAAGYRGRGVTQIALERQLLADLDVFQVREGNAVKGLASDEADGAVGV